MFDFSDQIVLDVVESINDDIENTDGFSIIPYLSCSFCRSSQSVSFLGSVIWTDEEIDMLDEDDGKHSKHYYLEKYLRQEVNKLVDNINLIKLREI